MVPSRIHCPQEKFGDPSQSEPLGAEQMGGVETVDLFLKDPDVVRTSNRFIMRRPLQKLYSWSCFNVVLFLWSLPAGKLRLGRCEGIHDVWVALH